MLFLLQYLMSVTLHLNTTSNLKGLICQNILLIEHAIFHSGFYLKSSTNRPSFLNSLQKLMFSDVFLLLQEHFQKLRIENSMGSSAPTSKQVANTLLVLLQFLIAIMSPYLKEKNNNKPGFSSLLLKCRSLF